MESDRQLITEEGGDCASAHSVSPRLGRSSSMGFCPGGGLGCPCHLREQSKHTDLMPRAQLALTFCRILRDITSTDGLRGFIGRGQALSLDTHWAAAGPDPRIVITGRAKASRSATTLPPPPDHPGPQASPNSWPLRLRLSFT